MGHKTTSREAHNSYEILVKCVCLDAETFKNMALKHEPFIFSEFQLVFAQSPFSAEHSLHLQAKSTPWLARLTMICWFIAVGGRSGWEDNAVGDAAWGPGHQDGMWDFIVSRPQCD